MDDNQYMSKEELASTIWDVATELRGKIDAGVYKNIILGFVFYKFVSENEYNYYKKKGFTDEEIETFNEIDIDNDLKKDITESLGYFISYDDMFKKWIKDDGFGLSNVINALNAFDRLIGDNSKSTFEDIFKSLSESLGQLGGSPQEKNKLLRNIIQLVNRIPVDNSQGYDTLGYIYEYLINQFASSAGKKAGEFYTPHEVSIVMSEIISDHLKNKEQIKIYDPTSGSASLLLNIGSSISKHMHDKNKIKYYAQELIPETFTLTRMNLIMKGIIPENIEVRCDDTLKDDWPVEKSGGGYKPLLVDAVVSNPPYSQSWKPEEREGDPRFSSYGYAPKSKADYAFLLHSLYHLDSNGIMAIVLPHGVLFRGKQGDDEYEIRKKLIEDNRIDTIIGLPSNIFYGTSIPTIIMILKKQSKNDSNILIIDASKGFEKSGNKNKLRARDIKKIVDTVIDRKNVEKYSRVVSRNEIIENDYNLNIPRYVNVSNKIFTYDIYATMFGGIPNLEIESFNKYWHAFPSLKQNIFKTINDNYSEFISDDLLKTINENEDVIKFKESYEKSYEGFDEYLKHELIDDIFNVNKYSEERELSNNIFTRLQSNNIIDYYSAYQLFMNKWSQISIDIDTIQSKGFDEGRKKIQVYVLDKKSDDITYVPKGYKNNLFDLSFIQNKYFDEDLEKINKTENELEIIDSKIIENLNNLSEEAKENDYYVEEEGKEPKFDDKRLKEAVQNIFENIENDELKILRKYILLIDRKASKEEKIDFIQNNQIDWSNIDSNKDGTYSKNEIKKHIQQIQSEWQFEDGTDEKLLVDAYSLKQERSIVNRKYKSLLSNLEIETWNKISLLTDDDIKNLLFDKWINSLQIELNKLPEVIIKDMVENIGKLINKYEITLTEVNSQLKNSEKKLSSMIDDLSGNDDDIKGLKELKTLLDGEVNER